MNICSDVKLYINEKISFQDGQYVGQQQEDQGYQSSLSSPNESQMKRTGWVIRRISLVDFCLLGGLSDESLQLTFVWCQIPFPICPVSTQAGPGKSEAAVNSSEGNIGSVLPKPARVFVGYFL